MILPEHVRPAIYSRFERHSRWFEVIIVNHEVKLSLLFQYLYAYSGVCLRKLKSNCLCR